MLSSLQVDGLLFGRPEVGKQRLPGEKPTGKRCSADAKGFHCAPFWSMNWSKELVGFKLHILIILYIKRYNVYQNISNTEMNINILINTGSIPCRESELNPSDPVIIDSYCSDSWKHQITLVVAWDGWHVIFKSWDSMGLKCQGLRFWSRHSAQVVLRLLRQLLSFTLQ